MSARRRCIAVVGDGQLAADDPRALLAERLGRRLADEGYVLLCGGGDGVMASACRGARSSRRWRPGSIVALLPGGRASDANPWVDIALPTGLGVARNVLVAHAEALIAVGGGGGTLAEMASAWVLGRLVLALRVPGWSGRLADKKLDDSSPRPKVSGDCVYGADDADEAVALLQALLPRYLEAGGA